MHNTVAFSGVGCPPVIARGGIVGWFLGDVLVFISPFGRHIAVVVLEILALCCESWAITRGRGTYSQCPIC